MQNIDIYKNIALSQVPRILGLGDRDKNSRTYGCFDRYYWHYKLIDFPNSRFQETALLLALLYKNRFEGNIYYKNENVIDWCKASMNFWLGIQRKNGSFDEVYPNENSFIATAFSTYAITEAALILKIKLNVKQIKKTGEWLIKSNNFQVGNQMASAAVALYNIYLITEDKKFMVGTKEKISKLLHLQHKDGFFYEYGGYDIGYLSIGISYLAKYYTKTKDRKIYEILKKVVNFVEKKIDKNGNYNYLNTSRKTQYIYPHGFKIMGSDIIKKVENGLKNNKIINPSWIDDRFCIPLAIDYLQTYLMDKK